MKKFSSISSISPLPLFFFILLFFSLAQFSYAQTNLINKITGGQSSPNAGENIDEKPVEIDPHSPRAFFESFLKKLKKKDFEEAIKDLDLRNVAESHRPDYAIPLVEKLKKILDRTYWYDPDEISPLKNGNENDDLPHFRDLITKIEIKDEVFPLYVDRIRTESGRSSWKISPVTLSLIGQFYNKLQFGLISTYLPDFFFELRIFSVPLWQFFLLILLYLISWPIATLIVNLSLKLAIPLSKRHTIFEYDKIHAHFYPPLRFFVTTSLFWILILFLDLPSPIETTIFFIIKTLFIIGIVWAFFSAIDMIHEWLTTEIMLNKPSIAHEDRPLLEKPAVRPFPMGKKSIKIVITFLAVLVILQNLGINITAFFAGLGVGGIAIALAGQKTIENLFGGAVLLLDRPVKIGDFCKFNNFSGTVEEIGLRSTKVRTIDRTIITIPNADFSQMQIENYKKRDQILFNTLISIRYDSTSEQIKIFLIRIKKMLIENPNVANDSMRVRLFNFGTSSIDIQIYVYVLTSELSEFLRYKEGILFDIKFIMEDLGIDFAFPTQTVYKEEKIRVTSHKEEEAKKILKEISENPENFLKDVKPDYLGDDLAIYIKQLLANQR